ncbi:PREDICTED: 39S ribosomal protein L44, mitochondrial [Dufourea novaeangliae]|uniref:Large ribosomal subunit protein mL44 n=1 Tax=Dufourea novaeangliae TaxID=178035 RepID=A0A154NY74_DUFNO|nr:PREDICTED: 39S ribosomal protein L44, mitochondrial [Dufourea novaeangliae]KZC04619.1 39S ribosomal protein L44, mitochondrial [Dufourea novaeangliae]
MNRLRLCFNSLANVKSVNYESCRHVKRWVYPTLEEINRRRKRLPPQPEPKRSAFIEWNRDAELYAFNQRLSENFETEKLNQALTHRSYIIREEDKQRQMGIKDPKLEIQHNEDFIKKGREITSKVVKNYLNKYLPRVPEPGIIAFHEYLMSQEILATASLHLGTKDIILSSEHPVKEETLAKTFLALVAALAESVTNDHASVFVQDFLIVGLATKDLREIWQPSEPFDMLNSIVSVEKNTFVEPRIIGHAGKNTLLSAYQIAVYSNKQFLGSGFGQTIKEAKNVAAMNALCRMFGLIDSSQPLRFDQTVNLSV